MCHANRLKVWMITWQNLWVVDATAGVKTKKEGYREVTPDLVIWLRPGVL
jgi:hypothetical protein